MLPQCNVVNLRTFAKPMCVELHASRNARSTNSRDVRIFRDTQFSLTLIVLSVPLAWQRGFYVKCSDVAAPRVWQPF